MIVRNITYNSIWFLISAQYFSKPPLIYNLPQQLFDKALSQLNSKFANFPVRLSQSIVRANKIEEESVPLDEAERDEFDKLTNALRQAGADASSIVPQKRLLTQKIGPIIKDSYSPEDDAWIIELRQKMLDFAATNLNLDFSENVNVIQKLSLEDITNYFEAEHRKIAIQNERNLESLGDRFLEQSARERWKIDFALPPDDILVDLKYNIPDEEEYLNYLEKKQLEGKDLLKPGEPIRQFTSAKYKPRIAPEDMVCQVCNDGDYTDDDLIVFCAVSAFD